MTLYTLMCLAGYTELGATAKSNTGLDYTALIVQKGKVDTTILGTYVSVMRLPISLTLKQQPNVG
jgi:hypothetical protein